MRAADGWYAPRFWHFLSYDNFPFRWLVLPSRR
jgi:hypothetical protein